MGNLRGTVPPIVKTLQLAANVDVKFELENFWVTMANKSEIEINYIFFQSINMSMYFSPWIFTQQSRNM